MEQQRRELDAGLPTAGERLQRTVKIVSLDFKFPGDFAAFPIRLAAVAHQELEGGFAREERIVLLEVADFQSRMADDLPRIEFVLAENASQQGRFARAVSSDESDFGVGGQRALRSIEQNLVTVAFVCIADLEQDGHGAALQRRRSQELNKPALSLVCYQRGHQVVRRNRSTHARDLPICH